MLASPMRSIICIRCGEMAQRHATARSSMCEGCMRLHRIDGLRASAEVTKAINNGELAPAREHACADCGNPARDWDHRDYLRPLIVEPLCKSCNVKRPAAFDSAYRPAGESAAPVVAWTDRRKRTPTPLAASRPNAERAGSRPAFASSIDSLTSELPRKE